MDRMEVNIIINNKNKPTTAYTLEWTEYRRKKKYTGLLNWIESIRIESNHNELSPKKIQWRQTHKNSFKINSFRLCVAEWALSRTHTPLKHFNIVSTFSKKFLARDKNGWSRRARDRNTYMNYVRCECEHEQQNKYTTRVTNSNNVHKN